MKVISVTLATNQNESEMDKTIEFLLKILFGFSCLTFAVVV